VAEPSRAAAPPLGPELVKGLWRENPVFVQALGLCPSLAVTNSAVNGLAMGLATVVVLVCSSAAISALRRAIPNQVRISTYVLIIATFVTVADFALQALTPGLHRALGAFISLIVVNCIILGRAEAFANRNPVLPAAADGLGMGLGFTVALLLIGGVREVLGNGSLFGVDLFGPRFEPWVIMVLPPGGFLVTGVLLLLFARIAAARQRAAARLHGRAEAA
jgi:electron transport complex protein RnfE